MVTSSAPNPQAAKRVLVVDDLSIRLFCTTNLKKAGYQVLEAEGSSEALARDTQPTAAIDLLLNDLFLPPPTFH